MRTTEQIISHFNLVKHPEGGFYRETYRSNQEMDWNGKHNISTCIYYLLTSETFSAFHRIRQDEIWHFYEGSTIEMHLISPQGNYKIVEIGNDFEKNQVPQFVVPASYWFGAVAKGEFALVGCTVSPGFDFNDFEIANRTQLQIQFPALKKIIELFTRQD